MRVNCDDVNIYDTRRPKTRDGNGAMVYFEPVESSKRNTSKRGFKAVQRIRKRATPKHLLRTSAPTTVGSLLDGIGLANQIVNGLCGN